MAAIGLTGGAFYAHFPSKTELFAEMIEREVENSSKMLAGDENSAPDHVAKAIRSYLSNYHAMHPEEGCGLAALGPEISRAGPEVKTKVEASLKKMQASWAERMDGNGDQAWSLLAQCIGTLILARVVDTEKTRREILSASRRSVENTLEVKQPASKAGRRSKQS
jgi:AcrR family transcriptional regulator